MELLKELHDEIKEYENLKPNEDFISKKGGMKEIIRKINDFRENFYNCCEEAVINFLYLDFNKIKGFDPNSNKVKIATSNNSRIFATEAFIKMNDCILKYREKMGALDEKCNINTGNALQDGKKKALEVPALYKAYVSAAEKLSQAYQNMIDAFEKLTNKEDVYPGRFESLNNRNLRIRKLTKGLRILQ